MEKESQFVITDEEREEVFAIDLIISRMQTMREQNLITEEMKEADEAWQELQKLPK